MANIFVGKEERFSRGLFLDKKAMKKEAQQILDEIGASHIRADDSIMRYNFEDRKLVEIARALYEKPELLIVDETTTACLLYTSSSSMLRCSALTGPGGW